MEKEIRYVPGILGIIEQIVDTVYTEEWSPWRLTENGTCVFWLGDWNQYPIHILTHDIDARAVEIDPRIRTCVLHADMVINTDKHHDHNLNRPAVISSETAQAILEGVKFIDTCGRYHRLENIIMEYKTPILDSMKNAKTREYETKNYRLSAQFYDNRYDALKALLYMNTYNRRGACATHLINLSTNDGLKEFKEFGYKLREDRKGATPDTKYVLIMQSKIYKYDYEPGRMIVRRPKQHIKPADKDMYLYSRYS